MVFLSPCIAKKVEINDKNTGGLKECVHFFLGNKLSVLQVEGEAEAYKFLKEYAHRK